MYKHIILIRHAQSEGMQSGLKDIERRLTSEGSKDAMRMGKLLFEANIIPDLILSSSAERTTETTRYICEQLDFDFEKVVFEEDLYESSVRLLVKSIEKINSEHKCVFLIAHNPSISYLAEYLTGEVIGNLPPCGVVNLSSEIDSWKEISQGSCELIKFYDPSSFD
jgi:phosphohistidine phosphatase